MTNPVFIRMIDNIEVNRGEGWNTKEVYTTLPNGRKIGRIDHFKMKSTSDIIGACARKVVKKEGLKGVHVITIELRKGIVGPCETKTINVEVTVY